MKTISIMFSFVDRKHCPACSKFVAIAISRDVCIKFVVLPRESAANLEESMREYES